MPNPTDPFRTTKDQRVLRWKKKKKQALSKNAWMSNTKEAVLKCSVTTTSACGPGSPSQWTLFPVEHHPLLCIWTLSASTGTSSWEHNPVPTSPWRHTCTPRAQCLQKQTHTKASNYQLPPAPSRPLVSAPSTGVICYLENPNDLSVLF